MNEPLKAPDHAPAPGFYYHFKHDPDGSENAMAYEVTGIGWHTETGEYSVMYRPLYEDSGAYTEKLTYLRPVSMFVDIVDKPEYQGPRFTRIEDASLIERLTAIRDRLYH